MEISKTLKEAQKNNNGLPLIELGAILFFAAYYLLPVVGNMFSEIMVVFLGLAYMTYILLIDIKESKFIFAFVLLAVYISLMYFLLTETSTINANVTNYGVKRFMSKFFQYFFMFFPSVLTLRFIANANNKQKNFILIFISLLITYVMLVTIHEIEMHPDITRMWDSDIETTSDNIASYYFVYAIPIIISVLIMFISKNHKILFKIIAIAFVIFSFVFLLQAQYTLSILIAMVGLILGFLISSKSTLIKIIVSISIVILMFLLPDILKYVATNVKSAQISIRFRELANFFSSGDASGYNLDGRLTLYWETIKAFFVSPLYGNRTLNFDGHATFLTILSDTGILGGIPFYILYFMTKKKIETIIEDTTGLFTIPFLMLVIMGLTNPIHAAYPVGFAIWFVVPLILSFIIENNNIQGNDLNGKLEN